MRDTPSSTLRWSASRFVRRVRGSPTLTTVALTGALAAVGLALALSAPAHSLLSPPGSYPAGMILIVAAAAFFLTELGQALIEFRHQAYSFSLTGIPMVLGLLYCTPSQLVLARVAAAVAAFGVQGVPRLKFGFNSAAYLLDTALVLHLAHWFIGPSPTLTPRTGGLTYLSLAVVDVLMSALVLLVIRINDGPLGWADVGQVLVPAAGFVAVNTTVGFTCAVLLTAGVLGGVLLAMVAALTAATYRGYVVLRRRHQSLEVVQRFIQQSEETGTADDLAGPLLGQIRALVRASRVHLVLKDDDGAVHVYTDTEGRAVGVEGAGEADMDLRTDALPDRPSIMSARSDDPSHREWLRVQGACDAMVAPVAHAGGQVTLLAVDRLGDATRFTTHDLSLFQALAGHLTVAMQNTRLVQRLRYDATHDTLTGLANRALLTERLKDALAAATASHGPAVLLLDLDRFKEVNDALGHHVGDQLLRVVAGRLKEVGSPGATVARLGGDEFAVLLPAVTGIDAEARPIAERLAQALRNPVDLPDVTLSTEASIGIALAQHGQTYADVLRHADTAMYAAKATGASMATYTRALDAGRAERLALLADLHVALERDEIEVHFQPKLDLTLDRLTGVEALIRWTHPTLGPLTPGDFIPLAESTGLIDLVTYAVLRKALRQCRVWQDAGYDLSVAVNLSARNVLNPALPEEVATALELARVPAHSLILEITESSVMGDPMRTIPTLEHLAGLGITLSLDDFGTGYSSLSYLQRLPVQEVKIDRSFVAGLTQERENAASHILVRTIIGLGTSLGLRIVAEGVEDARTMSTLRDLGCHIIQGYHIGRPAPADVLAPLLAQAHRTTVTSAHTTGH
jgi:diguanylate cyclase (GGDEF)-like protein